MRGFRVVATLVGIILLGGLVGPAVAADEELTSEQTAKRLESLRGKVERLGSLYDRTVDAEAQVVDEAGYRRARRLAEQIRGAFGQKTNTPLFESLQKRSAFIADVLKAQASQLATAVLEPRPAPDVQRMIRELLPDLNRSVIVAKQKVYPRGERTLQNPEAIRSASQEVLSMLERSIQAFNRGNTEEAARLANETFFVFESNGMGPDSSLLDETLENAVESDISNFGPGKEKDPGLEQLIRQGVTPERIQRQRDQIVDGVKQIRELLITTLPSSKPGDVNGDDRLSVTDALLIAQASIGMRSLETRSADVNCDNSITITDALLVAQASLNMRQLSGSCSGG